MWIITSRVCVSLFSSFDMNHNSHFALISRLPSFPDQTVTCSWANHKRLQNALHLCAFKMNRKKLNYFWTIMNKFFTFIFLLNEEFPFFLFNSHSCITLDHLGVIFLSLSLSLVQSKDDLIVLCVASLASFRFFPVHFVANGKCLSN